ncbi:MAG: ParB/RepB/Spo0J family partition protein [Thermoanaerobaculia bacterium]
MSEELTLLTDYALLPLAELEEDPNQPRRHFEPAELEELADSVEDVAGDSATPWRDGLLHPIVVYPSPGYLEGAPGGRYRILVGGRRFRAYQLRGWGEIPARIVEAPASVARTLMTQLGENLARAGTSLLEDALAVERAFAAWQDEHPQGRAKDFAAQFGRSPSWVSQHLAVAKATGLPRQAAQEGLLRHGEALRLFSLLPVELQRQLLFRARGNGTVLTVPVLRAAASERTGAPTAAPSGLEDARELAVTDSPEGLDDDENPSRLTLELELPLAQRLLVVLGLDPIAEPDALARSLLHGLEALAALEVESPFAPLSPPSASEV